MKKIKFQLLVLALAGTALPLAAQSTKEIIKTYLQKSARTANEIDFEVINEDFSKSLGGNIVKIQQSVNGIPVFNSVSTAILKNNEVKTYIDAFSRSRVGQTSRLNKVSKPVTFDKIATDFGIKSYVFVERITLENHAAEARPIIYHKIYFEKDGNLVLADQYEFEDNAGMLWLVIVQDDNGAVLLKEMKTNSCSFHHEAYSYDGKQIFPQLEASNHQESSILLAPAASASYNVFPLPFENPYSGSRRTVTNPWILNASPEGWQYVKTTSSELYSNYTRGNNVYATEDLDGDNLTIGNPAIAGSSNNFDFPLDFKKQPLENLDAAITNLFYVNNIVHDILYEFGFTETARNFQWHNFEKGGKETDFVIAQAQDASGTNNANFSSPADGSLPRMQMFLWEAPIINRLFYNSPAEAVTVRPETKDASFGPKLDATGISALVALGNPVDGCTAYPTDFFKDKIALIERGTCNFTVKVINAQKAGAKAAIVYNQNETVTFGTMGGTPAETVNIPSILIKNQDGNYMKSLLSKGDVNVTLRFNPDENISLDGSFDNGIIVHEYGHGLSNRLTGTGTSCLLKTQSAEQMGEGWSDFLALMLTNRPGDNANVARGVGNYALGESTSGVGLRPAKYSPNFSINNFTYAKTNGMQVTDSSTGGMTPDQHSIGFIWATMLWDLHWNFVSKYGYSSDVLANRNSGSGRVLQLVIDGMKLQACNPTFIDGREAILAADKAATDGENKCLIWNTFAKRGLGVKASAGDKKNINDQVEDFTVPEECISGTLATVDIKINQMQIFPNPAQNFFKVQLPTNAKGRFVVSVYDISGKLLLTKNIGLTENEISTASLPNGMYVVKAVGQDSSYTTKLLIKK